MMIIKKQNGIAIKERLNNLINNFSSIRNTKRIIGIFLIFLFGSLAIAFLSNPGRRLLTFEERENSGLEEGHFFESPNKDNIDWTNEIEPGTTIGDKYIENDYYSIYFSPPINKYVITIKGGDSLDRSDIEEWILDNIKNYTEFSNGVDLNKVQFFDERLYYSGENDESEVEPFIEKKPVVDRYEFEE